ncbi:holo-[acyl-carrier protein] synthase [Allopseudospirillum japonicum]|uniref:Holo-[acyl-carrier-protein] synthase n=1 Tax=Allopseudospirillum japonicum TaxID=64971 RepID=A0A1H6SM55_9GAMM|nr:holo-[acyl-carrier protein] synthase [Allopseudospirillum japonicum]
MILGLGNDLADIRRFQALLDQHGLKITRRILAEPELAAWPASAHIQAAFLAKRFAAKEAAAKALGTGFRYGMSLRHIFVTSDSLGAPQLHMVQAAAQRAQDLGVQHMHLALTDDGHYALATVILEK